MAPAKAAPCAFYKLSSPSIAVTLRRTAGCGNLGRAQTSAYSVVPCVSPTVPGFGCATITEHDA
ncbi:MAG: hypothetical protein JWO59_618 [Chloroflexi bacterium]|nr:hypothetical protein [Chloroflexota bacterium]